MGRFLTPSLAMVLLSAGVLFAQETSLGDLGRQQRSKQKAKSGMSAARVITDDDMPKRPDAPVQSENAKRMKRTKARPIAIRGLGHRIAKALSIGRPRS